jgi:hypothetical protein
VTYLFYHYFYKAAVGDLTWKSRLAENKRLRPVILEAYTHVMLCNQYFMWLYEYKADHPKTDLMMENDMVQEEVSVSGKVGLVTLTLFYRNLDLLEVSVPTSTTTSDSSEQESEEDKARMTSSCY